MGGVMGSATVEQVSEPVLDVSVDRLDGGEEAGAALAVEAADRTAQAVDGEAQLLALGLGGGVTFLQLGELALGDEVDRPDALAVGGEAVETRRFRLSLLDAAFPEAALLPQDGRRGSARPAGDPRRGG